MNVAYFLTPKNEVAWVPANATVAETLELMQGCGHATLPVLRHDGTYLGTVSEAALLTSVLRAEVRHEAAPSDVPIDCLPTDVAIRHTTPALGIDASMDSVLQRIVDHGFLPFVDDRGAFIGIVRRRDVVSHFARLLVASAPRLDRCERTPRLQYDP